MARDIHTHVPYIRTIDNGNAPTRKDETMWTMDNAEGFTQTQLDMINEVLTEVVTDGMDERNASDIINNAWVDSIHTAADLRRAVGRG